MKIQKHGVVIVTEGVVRVEGWTCEPEPGDPTDITPDQLLLQTAVKWALQKLTDAVNESARDALRRRANQKMLTASLPKLGQ
jgi:hypothetical protein